MGRGQSSGRGFQARARSIWPGLDGLPAELRDAAEKLPPALWNLDSQTLRMLADPSLRRRITETLAEAYGRWVELVSRDPKGAEQVGQEMAALWGSVDRMLSSTLAALGWPRRSDLVVRLNLDPDEPRYADFRSPDREGGRAVVRMTAGHAFTALDLNCPDLFFSAWTHELLHSRKRLEGYCPGEEARAVYRVCPGFDEGAVEGETRYLTGRLGFSTEAEGAGYDYYVSAWEGLAALLQCPAPELFADLLRGPHPEVYLNLEGIVAERWRRCRGEELSVGQVEALSTQAVRLFGRDHENAAEVPSVEEFAEQWRQALEQPVRVAVA